MSVLTVAVAIGFAIVGLSFMRLVWALRELLGVFLRIDRTLANVVGTVTTDEGKHFICLLVKEVTLGKVR